jgi:hypothetical protein
MDAPRYPGRQPARRRHAGRIARAALGKAIVCLVVALALLSGGKGTATAQVIHDDFDSGRFGPQWMPCHRHENEITIVDVPDQGFRAAKLVIRNILQATLFGLPLSHDCLPTLATSPERASDERAELWEADSTWLSFGSDIWYQFSMYIDPGTRVEDRLVIGQWKEAGNHGPMLAQRFNGRHFTITVEQENRAAGRDPADTECRIYIAHDASFDPASGGDLPHPRLLFVSGNARLAQPATLSFEHDPDDIIHDRRATEQNEIHLCARDISVATSGDLPDPWGRWTRMRYHIRATADSTGLIEVWADDQPVATVTGRIGFDEGAATRQYFKFGPYRNHPGYDSYALLARYTRAPRREDLP